MTRKLWFKIEPFAAAKKLRKRGAGPASKEYELDFRECDAINSALSDRIGVSDARTLRCNASPQVTFVGVMSGHKGFVLTENQRAVLVKKEQRSADIIFPYLIGREVVSGDGAPQRWIIDFEDKNMLDAQSHLAVFAWVSERVLPDVERKAKAEHADESARRLHLQHWWHHWRRRSDMKAAIANLRGRYITGSRTQRWPFVFCFMSSAVLPGDKMQVFAFDDDYSFGVLQALPHILWYQAKAARLKNEQDYNYSAESVFDTFPWPQFGESRDAREGGETISRITVVAAAARELRRVRAEALPKLKGGLRTLYRTLELPGANPLKDAHAALDAAVLAAYGFSAKKDLLAQLLELNLSVAQRLEKADPVTPPGIPATFPNPETLISDDCIRPLSLS